MKIWVRLAPAEPPVSGEPARAAPLERSTTEAPAGRGRESAVLQKLNAILTSFSQFAENCCQVCSWIGAAGGRTPPPRIRMSGVRTLNTLDGAFSSVASRARIAALGTSRASRRSNASCRATARTFAPLRMPASTNAAAYTAAAADDDHVFIFQRNHLVLPARG